VWFNSSLTGRRAALLAFDLAADFDGCWVCWALPPAARNIPSNSTVMLRFSVSQVIATSISHREQ
jgi:hypothetical protein